jgi:Ras-related GTP-binding protein A/B
MAKVLLMGPNGGGKTSMRSMVFANYLARDTARLGPTTHLHNLRVVFLGNFVLNMWDCGGQVKYLDEYLSTRRQNIFSGVAILVYTCDISALARDVVVDNGSGDPSTQPPAGLVAPSGKGGDTGGSQIWTRTQILDNLRNVVTSVREFSPEARLFVILHKTDLIAQGDRELIFRMRRDEMVQSLPEQFQQDIHFFATNIWDDSLFDAWSEMLKYLLPNMDALHQQLRFLAAAIGEDCSEVLLLERSTFLAVARVRTSGAEEDAPSAAKVSNTLKHFRLACHKSSNPFTELVFHLPPLLSLLTPFGKNTFIMIVFRDAGVTTTPAMARLNLETAKHLFFERLNDLAPLAELREMM